MNKFHPKSSELMPKRSTKCSAGYDFVAPDYYIVPAKGYCLIDTGVAIELDPDKVLLLYPRSSYGFKYGISLANTVGVIDSDFYPNEMKCKLYNDSFQDFHIKKGDKYMQGIITQFFKTDDDDADGTRNGGIGSTGA